MERMGYISIHAPLAGCDCVLLFVRFFRCISIHAPLAGCDWLAMGGGGENARFQSTHPLRGATLSDFGDNLDRAFQSTHPLRGATVYVQ